MKKNLKTIFTIIIIIVGIFLVSLYLYTGRTKKDSNQKYTNPAIYPAFRMVENYCIKYVELDLVNPDQYENCKKLNDNEKAAEYADLKPTDEDWYDLMISLGFDLPPYYLDRKPTDEEFDNAMKEQSDLLEIRGEIYVQQYQKTTDELEQMINKN